MELPIKGLTAEKAKDGQIIIFFRDGQISEYAVCVATISGSNFVKWTPEGSDVIRTALI